MLKFNRIYLYRHIFVEDIEIVTKYFIYYFALKSNSNRVEYPNDRLQMPLN